MSKKSRPVRPLKRQDTVLRELEYEFIQTVAGHTERLDAVDDMAKTLQQDLRDLRTQQQHDHNYLSSRIDAVQKDLEVKLDNQTEKLAEHFDKGIKSVTDSQESVAKRLTSLERWRILIVGGSIVVAFIIGDVLVRVFSDGPVGDALLKVLGLK